jgi:hypothetical protein
VRPSAVNNLRPFQKHYLVLAILHVSIVLAFSGAAVLLTIINEAMGAAWFACGAIGFAVGVVQSVRNLRLYARAAGKSLSKKFRVNEAEDIRLHLPNMVLQSLSLVFMPFTDYYYGTIDLYYVVNGESHFIRHALKPREVQFPSRRGYPRRMYPVYLKLVQPVALADVHLVINMRSSLPEGHVEIVAFDQNGKVFSVA